MSRALSRACSNVVIFTSSGGTTVETFRFHFLSRSRAISRVGPGTLATCRATLTAALLERSILSRVGASFFFWDRQRTLPGLGVFCKSNCRSSQSAWRFSRVVNPLISGSSVLMMSAKGSGFFLTQIFLQSSRLVFSAE